MELMRGEPEDSSKAAAWMPELYDCLHDLAARALQLEGGTATLRATALVHEAYLRLASSAANVKSEPDFRALAACVIRRVLVDHARARRAQKRGGRWRRVTLDPAREWSGSNGTDPIDLLALDDALVGLEKMNERAARVVELLFFSGFSIDEAAQELGISATTVDVDWRFARAWLSREIEGK